MGRIKSALEIALERTEEVKSDKSSIGQFEAKQKGKKLANGFLEGEIKFLEEEIKKAPKDERASLRQGIFDVLLSQIALPAAAEDQKRIETAGRGLQAVLDDSRFGSLLKQFSQILTRYLNETAQYEEAVKEQYAPKLRQKEEELSRRLGRQVQLDPLQDPEFVAFFNQNINALKGNYETHLDQVKKEAVQLFEGRP
jgi:hypothetical protein